MKISEYIYRDLLRRLSPVPPETGGILGAGKQGIIEHIYLDRSVQSVDCAVYVPCVEQLNDQIIEWGEKGIRFCGIFHTHMLHEKTLSGSDVKYIEYIMTSLPENYSNMYFPIVHPGVRMIPFLAKKEDGIIIIEQEELCIY